MADGGDFHSVRSRAPTTVAQRRVEGEAGRSIG
jgi:hypothetical protein